MKVLLATTNPGKVREVRRILPEVEWIGLDQLDPQIPRAEEPGETFEENALAKAHHYRSITGLPTLAEDSGLAVDALGGRPGVRSARYGGDISDPERCRKLLEELEGIPAGERGAAFMSCAVLLLPGREPVVSHGEVRGRIAFEPRGEGGFGYDPIFFYEPYGRTLAQATAEEKNAVSHRRRALEGLRAVLEGAEKDEPPD